VVKSAEAGIVGCGQACAVRVVKSAAVRIVGCGQACAVDVVKSAEAGIVVCVQAYAVHVIKSAAVRIVGCVQACAVTGSLLQYSHNHCPDTSYHTSPHLFAHVSLKSHLDIRPLLAVCVKSSRINIIK
jgi:hypothetical protein